MQNNYLDDFSILKKSRVILDFDGVMTTIRLDWSQLKEELNMFFKIQEHLPMSSIYMYAISINQRDSYLEIVSKHEIANINKSNISPLLKYLVDNNMRFSICSSNTRDAIDLFLKINHLVNMTETIVSINDIKYMKPNPEGLDIVIKKKLRSEYIYIGDSINDQIAANMSNIKFYKYEIK